MSGFEPGAVYRGLQEVQDGADPADVYARLTTDAVDPEEAIQDAYYADIENDHDHPECRDKFQRRSFCHGFTCVHIQSGIRIQVDCPCTCHQGEEL